MTDRVSLSPLGATLGETFYMRVEQPEHEVALQFIEPGGGSLGDSDLTRLTFAELHEKAATVARSVAKHAEVGDRALILCEPGVDYVAALFGCFYAGVIAVPAYPPMTTGPDDRVQRVTEDSDPSVVLTTELLASQCEAINLRSVNRGAGAQIVVVDKLVQTATPYTPHQAAPDALALLQYTSGSTGSPRGVMLSHANVLSNVTAIAHHLCISADDQAVFWLPPYHDMGLMGGLLTPVLHGFGTTFMSPLSFLFDPFLWLDAMTEYGTTISAAPNFAYEMCVRKARTRDTTSLDLRRLRVLINGAEPVSLATMNGFSECFRQAGFRRAAFMPSYGLAEATLMVSGVRLDEDVKITPDDGSEAEDRRSAGKEPAVSVGRTGDNGVALIVNTDTHNVCGEGETGEIWFQGPGVACGYWRNEEASRAVFGGLLASEPERGAFLRTGDLGALRDGELSVAGRLKDLIIVRGRNYYPHDIEKTTVEADARLRPGCVAAFEVERTPEPEIVIVAEVRDGGSAAEADAIWQNVRRHISEEHGLALDELVLIERGASLKTSSGKIRRRPTHEAYLAGQVESIAQIRADGREMRAVADHDNAASSLGAELAQAPGDRRDTIVLDLVRMHTAALLGASATTINAQLTFAQLGLDSMRAVELSSRLSEATGVRLPPSLVYDYPTPLAVAALLRIRAEGGKEHADGQRPPSAGEEPIAIIGMSCRYPGSILTPADLWQLVASGRDAIGDFPDDRGWDLDGLYDPDPDRPGGSYTRQGGFVDAVADFDADFFTIAPSEALLMDPQQRLTLEGAWEAVEHAGIDPTKLKGTDTGVFVGVMSYDYGVGSAFEAHHGFGYANVGGAMLSSRIAYTLGVHGPAISLDAACSSGLVAVHLACQALRAGECSLALAGGVTVLSHPGMFRLFSRQRRLAVDGRCKSFAAAADGAGFSEGMGLLALERLAEARTKGHRILAIVRGSATGHDGASNGLTAPNGPSQERVIRRALASAGVPPETVDAVEAQGSGTAIGDAIEAQALLATYGHVRGHPLWLGSVKSNIGHSHAAGGVAGVIKMVEAMRHGTLPMTLHVDEPTPHVDWSTGDIRLLMEAQQWTEGEHPRRAGISSFGATGTNTHLILEEPPSYEERPTNTLPGLPAIPFVISGKSAQVVRAQARRLRFHLNECSDCDLLDVAFSLATERPHFEYRAGVVGEDRRALLAGLARLETDEHPPDPKEAHGLVQGHAVTTGKLALLFPATPPRSPGTSEQLEQLFPVFAHALDDVCSECDRHLDRSVRMWMGSQLAVSTKETEDPELSRPATFAFQVALFRLVESLGIRADCLVGDGTGELVAAHVGGVLSLEDAVTLAVATGRLLAVPDDSAAAAGLQAIREDVRCSAATLPIFTSGAGRQLSAHDPIADSFSVDGASETADPSELARALERAEVRHFIELGQATELSAMVSDALSDSAKRDALTTHALDVSRPAAHALISCLAEAHVHGVAVNWHTLFAGRGVESVMLPTYAFQQKRYWPDDKDFTAVLSDTTRALSMAGDRGDD